jgi:predicted DNA-binding protein (MmcQ/YjbR family)
MNIQFLQKLCLSFPAATEDIKWGNDLCFSVGGKMFCVTSLEPPFKVAFKVKDEEFEELSHTEGFMPAPYMARAKWVLVTDPSKLSMKEWEQYIRQSYELKKAKLTKKARHELGIDPG